MMSEDTWRSKEPINELALCKTKKAEEKKNIWIHDSPFQQEALLLHKGGHIVSF